MTVVGSALVIFGVALCAISAIGAIRMPTTMSRVHAAAKAAALGVTTTIIGAGVATGVWSVAATGCLVGVFLFGTAPVSGHLLVRAHHAASSDLELVHDDYRDHDELEPIEVGSNPTRDFSVGRWVALTVVWVVLWRDPSVGTTLAGAAVAAVVEGVRRSLAPTERLDLLRLPGFVLAYLRMVVSATLRVAATVLSPRPVGPEAIVEVPLRSDSANAALLTANAVSFTPGTLTVELGRRSIHVHVVAFEGVDAVAGEIDRVERLAAALFRPR